MAGRSVNGLSAGQPEFMGYFGIQILLSDYGRTITPERARGIAAVSTLVEDR
jgi:hypothetical protein